MKILNVTKTQLKPGRHRARIAVVAVFAMLVATVAVVVGTDTPASARRLIKRKTVRTIAKSSDANYAIAISQDALTGAPATTVDYSVLLTKGNGLQSEITFDVPDLPSGYSFTVTQDTSTIYRLRISVSPTATDSSTVYVLRALNGGRERASLFRLTIVTPPKPTVATTVSTIAPTTTTTIAPPVAFSIKATVATRSAGAGETVAFPVTIDRQGYTGPVSFIAEGFPVGATLGYSPNPTLGNTTLYVTPQESTPSGRSFIVITAKVGAVTRTAAVQLTVTRTGAFTTVVGPINIRTTPGNDAQFRLDISGTSTVVPLVTIAVNGLPPGAALRTTDVVKAQNTVIVSTSASTPLGTYPVTLTLTSGTFIRKVIVSLNVAAGPSFSVTPEGTTVSVARGTTASQKVTITPAGGFVGRLAYTINDLPAGAQASYELPAVTAGSPDPKAPVQLTIKIAVPLTTPVGTFQYELVTSSDSIITTTPLTLVVG